MTAMASEDLTITAAEAERYLGIPARTVREWARRSLAAAHRGDREAIRLEPVGYRQDGSTEYDLEQLLDVMKRWRRTPEHTRPSRRRGS